MTDQKSFRLYCLQCTDVQLRNVYAIEHAAGRVTFWRIALEVMNERGIV
ncbi:hypothetical protein UFOVP393_46 [uncultured Caudovirales phage]|uniref:Uncharacterized protein n=1 Tax=uncultured Caudovirales phage TaxID=2100421 RepID=A0A6J7X589_9CAUD|nr:hypothetical protein UFOVP393_46 [uncultured Caudovirales phage]